MSNTSLVKNSVPVAALASFKADKLQLVKVSIILLLLVFLSACATLDRADCEAANWELLGTTDGSLGRDGGFLKLHQKACAKHGIEIASAEYMTGFKKGVEAFCIPATGYRLGLREEEYRYTCPVTQETDFLESYNDGLRDALTDIHLRSHHLEDRLWMARVYRHNHLPETESEATAVNHAHRRYQRLTISLENRLDNLRDREYRVRALMARAGRRLQSPLLQTPELQTPEMQDSNEGEMEQQESN